MWTAKTQVSRSSVSMLNMSEPEMVALEWGQFKNHFLRRVCTHGGTGAVHGSDFQAPRQLHGIDGLRRAHLAGKICAVSPDLGCEQTSNRA